MAHFVNEFCRVRHVKKQYKSSIFGSTFFTKDMRRKSILQYVTQTQVSVIIEDAYFSPFQGPII